MRDDTARGRRNEGSTPERAYWRSLEGVGEPGALRAPGTDSGEAVAAPSAELEAPSAELEPGALRTPGTDSGEAMAMASPEFPDGCDLPPDAVSRRDMLGLMAASLGLAGLTGCRRPVEHIVPYVQAPEGIIPGIPQHYATTMPLGTSALGLVVESHEGRPAKVEGNELHPSSRGAAGTWAQAAILDLYDPDRSPRPRRRIAGAGGGEGSAAGEGEAAAVEVGNATWDEFAAFWAERAAAAGDGVGLAFLSAGYSSPTRARLSRALRERFPRARWAVWEPAGDGNVFAGIERATGRVQRPVYRLERARAVLALDCDLLGTESEAVANARGWVAGRRVAPIEHAGANGHGAPAIGHGAPANGHGAPANGRGASANGHGAQGEPGGAADGMSRLYAVESTMTLTGAAADHRLRLPSRLAGSFLAAVAGELGVSGGDSATAGELPAAARARAAAIARDLAANPGAALVAVGRAQPPAVHALAHRVHQALGAVGATVTLHPLDDAEWGTGGAVVELAAAMRDGEVSTLVILGANPAYDAPADAGFAEALAKVEHTVHLGDREDETARLCAWRLPESHFLEAWGDARAAEGTPSVVQPLIEPLYDSRSAIELLALLAGGEPRSGHDLVRETWREGLGVGDDAAWRRVLHDGLLSRDAVTAPVLADRDAAMAALDEAVQEQIGSRNVAVVGAAAEPFEDGSEDVSPSRGTDYELTFPPSLAVFDGRFANNGWLQELPDPITKLTWDNAALISGGTAADLGVTTGDVIALEAGGRTVEAPVFILPGQADGSIALALGYGRTAAGRVGTGRGVDAYPLRTSAGLGSTRVAATRTGRRYPLTQTQEHWTLDEPITGSKRSLVQEATLERYREDPHFAHEEHPEVELFPERVYDSGHQWGMVVDLNACIGCSACVVACQSENNIPIVGKEQVAKNREMHWLRIDRYFSSPAKTPVRMADDPGVAFQPMPCQHCENAPCEQVCPVAATVHDSEGLNAMVYNRCIGTRYCSNNCPYKVRRFNFFNYTKDTPELVKLALNPDVTVRSRGVMEKCTYCVQRINEAKIAAKRADRPLVDGDVRTACQQTCPTGAIVFGDLLAEGSRLAAAKRIDRNYTLLAGLHNKPRTSYLARLRNPNPAWEEGA